MNKRFIRLLGTAIVALTVSSCNNTKQVDVSRIVPANPEALYLNFYSTGLVAGKSRTIVPNVLPGGAKDCKLTYTSSDSSIARVSSDGEITGVKGGKAVITVTAGEGENAISREVPVYVGNESTKNVVVSQATEQLAIQTATGKPSAIQVHEVRDTYTVQKDVRLKGYTDDCVYTVSEPEGFLGLDGYQRTLKVEDGAYEPTRYGWTFMTDEDYITHLYHISDSTKNRMSLPTQSYIGQPRINAVYDLINMILTRGKEIIVDQNFTTVYETSDLEDISGKNFGAYKDDNLNIIVFTYTASGPLTVDAEYESTYEIPAGTSTQVKLTVDYCFVNGVCVAETVEQNMSYRDENNVSLGRNLKIVYDCKINDDVVVNKPNNKDYSEVSDLSDL